MWIDIENKQEVIDAIVDYNVYVIENKESNESE